MRTGCRDSVASVIYRIARFPPLIRRWSNWMPHQFFSISPSPHRRWAIPWMRTCCWAVGGDLSGLRVAAGTLVGLAYGRLGHLISLWHAARMRLSRLYGSGYSLQWFRLLSECAGDCRLATCLWIRTGDYGTVGLLRREFLVVPSRELRRFYDSLFAGHLGVSRIVYQLRNRVY